MITIKIPPDYQRIWYRIDDTLQILKFLLILHLLVLQEEWNFRALKCIITNFNRLDSKNIIIHFRR